MKTEIHLIDGREILIIQKEPIGYSQSGKSKRYVENRVIITIKEAQKILRVLHLNKNN